MSTCYVFSKQFHCFIFFWKKVHFDKRIDLLNCTTIALIKNCTKTNQYEHKKTEIPVALTKGWFQDASMMKKIGIPLILLVFHSGQVSWLVLNEKKNGKFSLKSLRKRLQNLIKKSHETLVFSVKVRCHLQKVLSFNVSKELCNWIFFFMWQIQAFAIFLELWKIHKLFWLKIKTNRIHTRWLHNVSLS